MQQLQAVLAPEASGEEEKVHLVLSMEDGHKLQQALQLVPPQRKVILVHIHRPAMMIPIPTLGGTVHASILKDNIVKGYRDEQRDQALQALEGYREICTRAEIQAETLMTENDYVSAGLLGLIAEHKITTLIIIGIGKSWELTGYLNLVRDSHDMHQAFQSKCTEIVRRCQFIGGIDTVLGADSESCGEDYWKTIKAWPAAFEHIVSVINKVLQPLKQDSFKYNGLTPERILLVAEKLIDRFLKVASAVTEVRKSPEKLFCTLYMCRAIVDSTPSLKKVFPSDFLSRIDSVHTVLNDSAREILREFKKLIQNYSSQKVAQDGSILLITGYVMRYIRMLINHAGSLDTILDYGQNSNLFFSKGNSDQLLFEGISLTGHLEIEHSDIKLIVGAEWLKQRRDDFDMHMRDYMSSTWEQIFDSAFKETCNSQMNWKVPCPVLRSKLRDSISEHVTQAYKAYLETPKQSSAGVGRDFKSKVSELFEG
ncbi:exocyst complex component EXO70B2-like [Panicum hallii]|uniref:exocyst complex component EXO70B2-like n=1 Tax=Panicum hallii TaxID=206008 RepID=UPI000DF4CF70|nr:exocyst complex component EXO70B2-like [Panicum hallii]